MPFPNRPLELYTYSAEQGIAQQQWRDILSSEYCRYLGRKCDKIRKSQPDVTIGTCMVGYVGEPVVICPWRFLQRQQLFLDTLHLLRNHRPGNQLHVVPEVAIPGGSVDYFVVSVYRGAIQDYLGLEIQTLDTTGTVWPSRQRFIVDELGIPLEAPRRETQRSYGMNWKMTAKTILVQMHHKAETLELLDKKLILVIQDVFFRYIVGEFSTTSLRDSELSDSVQIHVYSMFQALDGSFSLELSSRHSTNSVGVEAMLGLRQSAQMSEQELLANLQAKLSDATLLQI